jgi:phosphate butyryltransferase
MIANLDQILDAIADYPVKTLAVAAAEQESVVAAVKEARDRNIAGAILFGNQAKLEALAAQVGLSMDGVRIVDCATPLEAAQKACLAVHNGEAEILMKGHLHTDDFLRAVLDKETGLRSGSVMSHVFILETTFRGKLTMVTDGAMNIAPDLVTKAEIIMNAVYFARCLGIERPKVGVLAAVELVNPKMPATLDAAALNTMQLRGQFPDCIVDGPFALDNAISKEAAIEKGIGGEVAGDCDIIVTADIETGNALAKSFAFLCGGRTAGVLIGAAAPIVLTSRADSAEAKLYSIAASVLMADMTRDGCLKAGKVHY